MIDPIKHSIRLHFYGCWTFLKAVVWLQVNLAQCPVYSIHSVIQVHIHAIHVGLVSDKELN